MVLVAKWSIAWRLNGIVALFHLWLEQTIPSLTLTKHTKDRPIYHVLIFSIILNHSLTKELCSVLHVQSVSAGEVIIDLAAMKIL